MNMEKYAIYNIRFNEGSLKVMEAIKQDFGLDKDEVVRRAIGLFDIWRSKVKEGSKLGYIDAQGNFTEIVVGATTLDNKV